MHDLKQTAQRIFRRTLAAIDIPSAMRRKLDRTGSCIYFAPQERDPLCDLREYERICAVAVGKAAVGLEELLWPDFRAEGILVAPPAPEGIDAPEGFRVIVGGHPIPDEGSLQAGRAVLDLLAAADERTLVFFLLSGGGSALLEQPLDPALSLAELQDLYRCLVQCGASIDEVNIVRKHLSAVKGGRLALAAPAAKKITLGISDVPDGHESALASGPTLPDSSTVSDACAVIHRYGLLDKLPLRLCEKFRNPELIPETPKPGAEAFRGNIFELLLERHDLTHPAHRASEAASFVTVCDNTTDDWPVERAAEYLLAQLAELKRAFPERPVAIIAEGEVSSPVTGDGVGGRNSAFVLHCVPRIAGQPITVLSAGTDGIDGSSPAAGACADGESYARALRMGLDPADFLRRSDSYTFFHRLGDAIETGPTGNNLRDFRILLTA
jgi:hydroxypyruvate reductase